MERFSSEISNLNRVNELTEHLHIYTSNMHTKQLLPFTNTNMENDTCRSPSSVQG